MAALTSIEWTDRTWNPVRGCSRVSEGCRHCYAEGIAARFGGSGQPYEGLGAFVDRPGGKREARWTGAVRLVESVLTEPLTWRKPAFVFVNSMSDLFHEGLPDEAIDKVFAVMALAPHLTFQVLTKRPERMREYFRGRDRPNADPMYGLLHGPMMRRVEKTMQTAIDATFPLRNVWLGVSIEDQSTADARIPILLDAPAAVRFVSAEPLLGPVNIRQWMNDWGCGCGYGGDHTLDHCPNCGWVGEGPTIEFEGGDAPGNCPVCDNPLSDYYACPECEGTSRDGSGFGPNSVCVDWVICGGESGPGARPMHPDWARGLRDQCKAAGVPFFFKQWGKWASSAFNITSGEMVFRQFDSFEHWVNKASTWINGGICLDRTGTNLSIGRDFMAARDEGRFPVTIMHRVGKRAAGRTLDGVIHDARPEVR